MADRLVRIFSDVLGVESDRLSDATSTLNTPAWDSMANIMLVTEIEASFAVELSTADIGSMDSIGRARSVLERLGVSDFS